MRRLDYQLVSHNFTLSEEKKIVAEIDSLKRSKKVLEYVIKHGLLGLFQPGFNTVPALGVIFFLSCLNCFVFGAENRQVERGNAGIAMALTLLFRRIAIYLCYNDNCVLCIPHSRMLI